MKRLFVFTHTHGISNLYAVIVFREKQKEILF